MVAITLLSLLMVSIFTITDSSIDTKDQVVLEDREFLQVQTFLDRLDMDFSQIYSPLYFSFPRIGPNTPGVQAAELFDEENPPPRYQPTEKFPLESHGQIPIPVIMNEDAQSLIFMTSSNRRKTYNSNQSRYAWVSYYLTAIEPDDPDDPDEELSEMRRGTQQIVRAFEAGNPYQREFDWDRVRSYPLLKGVKDFRFEFWDRDNERFVELLRGLPRDNMSPRLLRVSFTWVSSDGSEFDFSRTFRPLYPYFDSNAEQAIHLQVMRESAQARRAAREGNPNDRRDEDDFDDQGGFF